MSTEEYEELEVFGGTGDVVGTAQREAAVVAPFGAMNFWMKWALKTQAQIVFSDMSDLEVLLAFLAFDKFMVISFVER